MNNLVIGMIGRIQNTSKNRDKHLLSLVKSKQIFQQTIKLKKEKERQEKEEKWFKWRLNS